MAADVHPDELRRRVEGGEPVFVLDVREDEEVAEWPFPGAVHIPLGTLGARTAELPDDVPIVVVCHSGVRSKAVADALARAGWPADNLAGGIVAWAETAPGQEA